MENDLIFADTNLFLVYLANDIPQQADAFEQLRLQTVKGELALITNHRVIAEIV